MRKCKGKYTEYDKDTRKFVRENLLSVFSTSGEMTMKSLSQDRETLL